jgi:hypothetical protein
MCAQQDLQTPFLLLLETLDEKGFGLSTLTFTCHINRETRGWLEKNNERTRLPTWRGLAGYKPGPDSSIYAASPPLALTSLAPGFDDSHGRHSFDSSAAASGPLS